MRLITNFGHRHKNYRSHDCFHPQNRPPLRPGLHGQPTKEVQFRAQAKRFEAQQNDETVVVAMGSQVTGGTGGKLYISHQMEKGTSSTQKVPLKWDMKSSQEGRLFSVIVFCVLLNYFACLFFKDVHVVTSPTTAFRNVPQLL